MIISLRFLSKYVAIDEDTQKSSIFCNTFYLINFNGSREAGTALV